MARGGTPEAVTFPHWDDRLLEAMGLAPTPARRLFLQAWAACEGGTAHYNPLNTTLKVAGSTTYNSAGVQNFPDELAGIAATLLTLRLHFYVQLRAALATPSLSALDILGRSDSAIRTWGTDPRCIRHRVTTRV